MAPETFLPERDVPDLCGKVIFITGGTAGIGKQTIINLAKHSPSHIYFSGRNYMSADAVIAEVKTAAPDTKLTFVQFDLGSLNSVKEAIAKLEIPRLDILICNAGIMAVPLGLTTDGYEIQFGTNFLGHALLIHLLLPTLLQHADEPNADPRVVILTSQGFSAHPVGGIVFKNLRTVQNSPMAGPWIRYGQSKLAGLLYARELAARYPSITSTSIHPGVINTGLVTNLSKINQWMIYLTNVGKSITEDEGTHNTLWAATSNKSGIVNGEYYEPVGQLGKHARESKNNKLAKELWEWTEKELQPYVA
ncbi:oxidoreductase [Crucibulum laeve]|uniref:Oxidoreductase n=1 Tax=Crucibulum laeve TaxID=68775 RepID=A0A5C3M092_9AGAR|nr:oxidoreductase [Crucibulum laeve]